MSGILRRLQFDPVQQEATRAPINLKNTARSAFDSAMRGLQFNPVGSSTTQAGNTSAGSARPGALSGSLSSILGRQPLKPSVGPTIQNAQQRRSQQAQSDRLTGLAKSIQSKQKPTGDPVYNLTDPGTYEAGPDPDPYPTVLPSLSSEQLGVLAERRRLADQRLKQAKTEKERGTALLEASATRARESATRDSRRSIEDFMRDAGGKGLARSPMVAGRFQRRAGEDLRLSYGEIDTRLSTEIAALQDMVSQAELARSDELAGIKSDEVNMRADLERLFPAAGMYG